MPLYEYRCRDCGREFEALVRGSETPVCPHCTSVKLEKLLSVPAAPSFADRSLPMAGADSPCGRPQCAGGGCMFGD
ncbi:MAG TPA: zinc ribbon domain-containing protein [Pirellulaceae bacterium]|nr:zinc ribbon domain-containing protein [Pirellulaceae bacterium]